jgi:DNA-binding MarR family transcriptional regulator
MSKSSAARQGLGALVGALMRQMHRYDSGRTLPILQGAKLTTGQLAALELARTPRTLSAIASALGLSRPATSQIVDKLARARYVRRTEGDRDRRERRVALTTKGQALLTRVTDARAARFDQALAAVPAPLATRFATVLSEVVETLNQQGDAR